MMKKRKKKESTDSHPYWKNTNGFLQDKSKVLMFASLILYLAFSFFTFSLRISEGGDDSTYIIRALSLLEKGRFPDYQGPLYPLVLAGFIAVFGTKIAILKLTSWLFLSLSVFLLFKAFYKKISPVTLWGTIFALIVNHHFLYFGSQTYSEAFFMALQGGFLLYLFHTIENSQFKKPGIHQTLIIALILFSLTLTRTIAIAALPALIIFWIAYRQPRAAISTTLFFILFAGLFIGAKTWLSDTSPTEEAQINTLLLKNPYNIAEGREHLGGFFARFAGNSKIYLSKFFLILTGFKPAMSLTKPILPAIILYAWFLTGLVRFYRRNKILFFTGLYLAFMLGTTFFALQTLWDQVRLIIPFFPLMIIFLIETVISYTSNSKFALKQKIPVALLALSIVLISAQTIKQTDFTAIFKNVAGDRYYGYTPDWQNYLKMAEHVEKEVSPDSYVACRKPSIARVYAKGKKFYGIYRYDTENADSLLTRLHERNVTHIIVASLRKNPRANTGHIINTIHRYMGIIAKKYPQIFILQHKIGETEPAWLFKIDYNKWRQQKHTDKQTAAEQKK